MATEGKDYRMLHAFRGAGTNVQIHKQEGARK